MKNKKGAAFEWLYGLVFLVFLGVIFILFNYTLTEHIKPASEDLIPDNFDGKGEIVEQNDKMFSYWMIIPIIVFIMVVIFIFLGSIL